MTFALLVAGALFAGSGASPDPDTARFRFSGPDELTVQCVAGCPTNEKIYLPERFPSLSLEEGKSRRVRLRFRATGFRSKTLSVDARAGENRIDVSLDPV